MKKERKWAELRSGYVENYVVHPIGKSAAKRQARACFQTETAASGDSDVNKLPNLVLATALALLGTACGPSATHRVEQAPQPANTRADAAEGLTRSSVLVKVLSERFWGQEMFTIEGFGSGFVLDSASGPLVVTAHHVVRGATEVVVIDHLGRRWQANRVAALDEEADIAVLPMHPFARQTALCLGSRIARVLMPYQSGLPLKSERFC